MNIHWTLNNCTDCSVWQSQRKLRGFEAEQLKSHTADYTVTQWVLFRVPGSPWGPERGFGSLFGLLFMFRVPFFSILDYRMQRIAARIIVDRILKGHCKNCTQFKLQTALYSFLGHPAQRTFQIFSNLLPWIPGFLRSLGFPGNPLLPGFPGFSGFLGIRGFLGLAKFPGFTGFPGFPGFAECLGFSVFPGFPGLSRFPGFPGFLGLTGFPWFPRFPVYPGCQGFPEFTK